MSKFAEKNRVINLGYTELAINFKKCKTKKFFFVNDCFVDFFINN